MRRDEIFAVGRLVFPEDKYVEMGVGRHGGPGNCGTGGIGEGGESEA